MKPSAETISNWKQYHQLFSSAFIHEALGAAVDLKIADHLDDQPASASEIAECLALTHEPVYRLMRALAAYGIFEEAGGKRFKHNSYSRLLREDHPYSMRGLIKLWLSRPFKKAWDHFAFSIRDGQAGFVHGNEVSVYEYAGQNPYLAELFHTGMESNSAPVADAIADCFSFSDYGSVVDLGGGAGTQLKSILKRHNVRGAIYDLPEIADATKEKVTQQGETHQIEYISGSWFEAVPAGFGVYLIKNSLWNWPDVQCRQILTNVRQAMGPGSQLLIIEYLVNLPADPWSAAFDLQQLNITGGRGRTKEEYCALLQSCGLTVCASFKVENESVLHCRLPD